MTSHQSISRRSFLLVAAGGALASLALPRRATAAPSTNRFGTPWLGEIAVPGAITHTRPSDQAPPIGPLRQGSLVPVVGLVAAEGGSSTDAPWYATTVGFLPLDAVDERRRPFIAQVDGDDVPVRRGPRLSASVWRPAQDGDVVRVVGISPDVDGRQALWWATTIGWLPLDRLRPADGGIAESWPTPTGGEALGGWWAEVTDAANVRLGPTTEAARVGLLQPGTRVKVLGEVPGETIAGRPIWLRLDGGRYAGAHLHSSLARRVEQPAPTEPTPPRREHGGTWIVVDRGRNVLTLFDDGRPAMTTFVSLGNAGRATPAGEYATMGKFRFDDMTSTSVVDPSHPYDLPNVPSVQYYRDGGFAIHGTYWHDDFSRPHSEGCVNLTIGDALYLFAKTRPTVPADANARWQVDVATPVVIGG